MKKKKKDFVTTYKLRTSKNNEGFSLIEILIALFLLGIALLGMAQLFAFSVLNNSRSEKMTNATFLAQQQIDFLRILPASELNNLVSSSPIDEFQIDINNDSIIDFRRVTQIQSTESNWNVKVLVFPGDRQGESADTLSQSPLEYGLKAEMNTIISR